MHIRLKSVLFSICFALSASAEQAPRYPQGTTPLYHDQTRGIPTVPTARSRYSIKEKGVKTTKLEEQRDRAYAENELLLRQPGMDQFRSKGSRDCGVSCNLKKQVELETMRALYATYRVAKLKEQYKDLSDKETERRDFLGRNVPNFCHFPNESSDACFKRFQTYEYLAILDRKRSIQIKREMIETVEDKMGGKNAFTDGRLLQKPGAPNPGANREGFVTETLSVDQLAVHAQVAPGEIMAAYGKFTDRLDEEARARRLGPSPEEFILFKEVPLANGDTVYVVDTDCPMTDPQGKKQKVPGSDKCYDVARFEKLKGSGQGKLLADYLTQLKTPEFQAHVKAADQRNPKSLIEFAPADPKNPGVGLPRPVENFSALERESYDKARESFLFSATKGSEEYKPPEKKPAQKSDAIQGTTSSKETAAAAPPARSKTAFDRYDPSDPTTRQPGAVGGVATQISAEKDREVRIKQYELFLQEVKTKRKTDVFIKPKDQDLDQWSDIVAP